MNNDIFQRSVPEIKAMTSLKKKIGDEPLAGMYYKATVAEDESLYKPHPKQGGDEWR